MRPKWYPFTWPYPDDELWELGAILLGCLGGYALVRGLIWLTEGAGRLAFEVWRAGQ